MKMKKRNSAKIIGVTGKTGAGKGFITEKLAANNSKAYIIDADKVYHSMLGKSELKASITSAFGHNILDKGGNIDRKKLAVVAFSDEKSIQKLNQAVLPYVAKEISDLTAKLGQEGYETIYLDAPTLIESGIYKDCDEIIFVKSPKDVRKKRIIERDGLSDDEARQRMSLEKDDEFYLKYANKVIEN